MKTSEQIDQLATALSKAQGAFENPVRNRSVRVATKAGGEYTFHYTTLDQVISMIRPGMAANGLAFTQSVTLEQEWVIVTTRIMHASGQFIEDELPVKPDGFSPQQVGSAITYGKRYALTALLGIASDEDDDGNLGSGHTSEEIKQSPPPKRNSATQESKPACPECGKSDSVIKGKEEFGGGWVCFKKKDGCGAKWQDAAKLAEQFNMTTADKLPPPPDPPGSEEAGADWELARLKCFNTATAMLDKIDSKAPDAKQKIEKAALWIRSQKDKRLLNPEQDQNLLWMLAEIEREIPEAVA